MDFLEINNIRYKSIRLLGKGKGGYSYLVERDDILFVIKQLHHEPCEYYSFGDKLRSELQDYQRLSELQITMPKMLEVDYQEERILKEYIPGDTIDHLILEDNLPAQAVEQLGQMCATLYRAGLNIDYYPTNFIFWDGRLYYIDYECNHYMEQWNFENWGRKYWSKTPEFLAAFA